MNILDKIIEYKKSYIQETRELKPVKLLERSLFFNTKPVSLKKYLNREDRVGIIAEIKRSSPSAGMINNKIDVEELSIAYMQAGASALSVLTDQKFFNGNNNDLEIARKYNYCPILRKDFIIDEYQLIEAKSIGADCILLIAACLNPAKCQELAAFAKSLDLEVLLEIREKEDIETHVNEHIDLIGVNNRDLKTFRTDLLKSKALHAYLPKELTWISESGISQPDEIIELKKLGYKGFLIGGYFMKYDEPGRICQNLIKEVKTLMQ
ncbi:MAG: indole-3-glycerol phosphate synthase TrpC [Saprospiraceae bacterium]|nr:indole-3-glycerol phosphate synthase TrpC [Saprospiraceae bacterium]